MCRSVLPASFRETHRVIDALIECRQKCASIFRRENLSYQALVSAMAKAEVDDMRRMPASGPICKTTRRGTSARKSALGDGNTQRAERDRRTPCFRGHGRRPLLSFQTFRRQQHYTTLGIPFRSWYFRPKVRAVLLWKNFLGVIG